MRVSLIGHYVVANPWKNVETIARVKLVHAEHTCSEGETNE